MKNQLVNTARISISNFTFDSKTNTISFFSTKTNKCWSVALTEYKFNNKKRYFDLFPVLQKDLNELKKLCKNGNN